MREATIIQRLRRAGLRPTIARIGVLQAIEAASPRSICADDVFRQMLLRGTRVSNGTVYRALGQFEAVGLLLREWDGSRTAYYRMKPVGFDAAVLRLVCADTGHTVVLDDPDLHARLIAAVRRNGLDLAGQAMTIHAQCACSGDPVCRMSASFTQTPALDRRRCAAAGRSVTHLRPA